MKPFRTLVKYVRTWPKLFRTLQMRPHLSTLVLQIPVLIVLVLANVPGRRAAYLDPLDEGVFQPGISANYEHGWPLTHLRRKTLEIKRFAFNQIRDIRLSPWDLPHGIIDFHLLALVGNVAAGIGILILTGVFIETRRRRRQSCFQFHLGELLALVTFVAIALSFYAIRRKEYIEECKVYEFLHRDENGPSADWSPNGPDWQLEGPDWLLPILGKDRYYELFARLCAVEAWDEDLKEAAKLHRLLLLRLGQSSPVDTALLVQIPTLEAIQLKWNAHEENVDLPLLPRLRALGSEMPLGSMTDPLQNWKITGIAGLKSLESLSFTNDQFDDTSMAELDGLTHLHWLDLSGTKITSGGVRHLQKATELDWLIIARTKIDDAALRIIGQMRILAFLDLSETHVTDVGLESLKSLKDLHNLHLNGTSVTAEGVRRFQQALPNCEIEWSPP